MLAKRQGRPAAKGNYPFVGRPEAGRGKRFMLIVSRNGIEVGRKIVEARSETDASGEIYRFVAELRLGVFERGITHKIEELRAPPKGDLAALQRPKGPLDPAKQVKT
jgi:hypothetical protein